MLALVLDFADIDANQLSVVGGKAVNLGVMTRAGFAVPPGVCVAGVTANTSRAAGGLEKILNAIAVTQATDTTRLAALAGEIRVALLVVPVPEEAGARWSTAT
jgi:pyruvate,water dikinase